MADLKLFAAGNVAQCGKYVIVCNAGGDGGVFQIDITTGVAKRVTIDERPDAAKDQRPVGDGVSKDIPAPDPSEPA